MRALGLALLVLGLSFAAASAQTGLQRFETAIKPYLPLQRLTYNAPRAIGAAGFSLDGVEVVIPPTAVTHHKEVEFKVRKVVVQSLDFDRLKAETQYARLPRFGNVRFEGLSLDDGVSGFLQAYGIPRGPIDLSFDYRLEPATDKFTLSNFEVVLPGYSYIKLSMVVDGISDKTNLLQYAKDVGRIRSAALELSDHDLLANVLPAVAAAQGLSPEAVVSIAKAFLRSAAAGDPSANGVSGLLSFLTDWKQPRGPLTVSIRHQKPMKLSDFGKVLEPGALSKVLGLVTNYPKQADSTGD